MRLPLIIPRLRRYQPALLSASLFATGSLTATTHAQTATRAGNTTQPALRFALDTNRPSFDFSAAVRETSPFPNISSSADTSSSESDTPDAESKSSDLPDAPSWIFGHNQKTTAPPHTHNGLPIAADRAGKHSNVPDVGQYTKYIPAGYVTHPQTVHEKQLTGARDLYSFGNIAGWFISSGWSQLRNASPNYGTDKGAYGERLGAAALRSVSQGVFTDMVFAPMLHQDLRYYVKGPQHSIADRTLYAASRVFIARRDTTSTTINTALLSGYFVSAALTPIYYPSGNRGFGNVMSAYGTSLGGAMLINVFNEFRTDILMAGHLKKKTYQPFNNPNK
ncbi:MAG: hypothetical protein PW735_01430 [Acidobacteriaceae bacterium]|nr:hypothetical protein [Acidobacteriaceae bacterium]